MFVASFLERNECLLHFFLEGMFVASFLEGNKCLLSAFLKVLNVYCMLS